MHRAVIGGLVVLVVLVLGLAYVFVIHVPRSTLDSFQAQYDEIQRSIPASDPVARGLRPETEENMLPDARLAARLLDELGEPPTVYRPVELDDELRSRGVQAEAQLEPLLALLGGRTASASAETSAVRKLNEWLILRVHLVGDHCDVALADAARFGQAVNVAHLDSTGIEADTLRKIEGAILPCASGLDGPRRVALAEAFERLADQRLLPRRFLPAPRFIAHIESARTRLSDEPTWGVRDGFQVQVSALETGLADWARVIRDRDRGVLGSMVTRDHDRRAERGRIARLRLFSALLRAHGLEGAEARAAIADLRDPLTNEPLQIDDETIRATDEEYELGHRAVRRVPRARRPALEMAGVTRESIRATIRTAMPDFTRCYERELWYRDPGLEDRVQVEFDIDASGVVDSVSAQSEQGIDALERCVAAEIRLLSFPPSDGGIPTTVNYPFVFESD